MNFIQYFWTVLTEESSLFNQKLLALLLTLPTPCFFLFHYFCHFSDMLIGPSQGLLL